MKKLNSISFLETRVDCEKIRWVISMDATSLAIVLLFVTIIVLASLEKMDKAVLALIGIILTYIILNISEKIEFNEIFHFIDFKVLLTIFGFMVIVEASRESGLFQFISMRTVKLSGGEPTQLFVILCIITTLMSMFMTAMATMIIIGTLTITIARMLKIDPGPYLLAEAIIVDVGGMALPFSQIGNIIISQGVGLSLIFFIMNVMPFVAISFIFSMWYLLRNLQGKLGIVDPLRKMLILEANEWILVPDINVFKRSIFIFSGIIIGLIILPEIYLVAVGGATLFLLASGVHPDEVLKRIDWATLLFFIALYIIVGAMEHKGLLHEVGVTLGDLTGGDIAFASIFILWIVGLLSCAVDNVAIAIAFIPIVKSMAEASGLGELITILWISMILGTNLGGNILPYGAPTTILAMGVSKKHGYPFSIRDFLKIGSVWGLSNLALASVYILLRLYLVALIQKLGLNLTQVLILVTIGFGLVILILIHVRLGLRTFVNRISKIIKSARLYLFTKLINKFKSQISKRNKG